MAKNLEKTYNPHEFEDRIYKMWEVNDAFLAKRDEDKKPFTIMMPPPNITGQLHMGHALDQTLQDVLTRYKRMCGYSALWLPGSDHASIATEVRVAESILKNEGKTKEDLGRDEFLKRAWAWKEEYGGRITKQCRKLGDSCDWSRERFTMDEGCNHAVVEAFVRLYEKGLIYRGNRMINWCPDCGTSLSDAEVEHVDVDGKYWYYRYPGVDGGEDIVIATSRPETMFADVAIAVSPDDPRYETMIGMEVELPLVGKKISIIADPYPDPEKGTGAVKITPAHDENDFEVGQRHNLDMPVCIDEDGRMTELAGKYAGMDRYECREAWTEDLKEAGYLVKIEDIEIPTGTCYRCHTSVEPMLSDQWFVSMKELAEPALEVAREGKLKHVPDRFSKIYMHWLEEIRDWCISRQLWWGHRIPAYYCDDCGEMMVARRKPEKCSKCGSENLHQDEDVLDTWFSSALWPFSTLGWPEETPDMDYFYPTSVLVTGYDIIFFWVVRMVFSALEFTGDIPFEHVYVHGLVRDSEGRKMSKSLGNGIDPLEVIEKVGADALRFMLISGITPGNDMRFREEKIEAARNFANKLWNASRFVIMNLQDEDGNFLPRKNFDDIAEKDLAVEDRWLLAKINLATKEITDNFEEFELSLAASKVENLIWNIYCDWYIELVKARLQSDDEEDKKVVRAVLVKGLQDLLRLLHPFMPFITEEIWGILPDDAKEFTDDNPQGYLIRDRYPHYDENISYEEEEDIIDRAMDVIAAVRQMRRDADAATKIALNLIVLPSADKTSVFKDAVPYIQRIANVKSVSFIEKEDEVPEDVLSTVVPSASLYVPAEELVDFEAEFAKLENEKKRLQGEVLRVDKMLANEGFMKKAPQAKIDAEKDKKAKYEEMLAGVEQRLAELKKRL